MKIYPNLPKPKIKHLEILLHTWKETRSDCHEGKWKILCQTISSRSDIDFVWKLYHNNVFIEAFNYGDGILYKYSVTDIINQIFIYCHWDI